MTDAEFEVIDELYFPTDFDTLLQQTQFTQQDLKQVLTTLHKKGWLRCFELQTDIEVKNPDLEKNYKNYRYNASKKGLLAHNGFE
jgi:hypothetical protein